MHEHNLCWKYYVHLHVDQLCTLLQEVRHEFNSIRVADSIKCKFKCSHFIKLCSLLIVTNAVETAGTTQLGSTSPNHFTPGLK